MTLLILATLTLGGDYALRLLWHHTVRTILARAHRAQAIAWHLDAEQQHRHDDWAARYAALGIAQLADHLQETDRQHRHNQRRTPETAEAAQQEAHKRHDEHVLRRLQHDTEQPKGTREEKTP